MNLLILLYAVLFGWPSETQVPSTRWLVELKANGNDCIDDWWIQNGFDKRALLKKPLPVDNWMVVEIPAQYVESLSGLNCISSMHKDQRIEWRNTEPNDPSFINQADMELIGMTEAWDIATGGVTKRGDTIVVALIDFGYQVDHNDLKENIWINHFETPGDNIDNDGNGYVDDYRGLNIQTGKDDHLPGNHHGTEVAGVIGAHGNNELGIAGVNWHVKMMLVSGAEFESELIEAYEYALEMRKKYKVTNGEEGAFVVATNLSGGIDNAFAADHPLWCAMYDKLGEEGILSVAAAPNLPISVDVDGDMPTTCTSEFLIAVTNVDVSDEIVGNAGFGPVSIDIGAPGHGTISTTGNNSYKAFSGTSASAPHVTGAIALMYSAACDTLLENIDNDPEGVALTFKEILLNTGTDNNSLQDITQTGKRLQVDAALREATAACRPAFTSGVRITAVQPNPATTDLVRVYFEVKGDTSTAVMDLIATDGKLVSTFPISSAEYAQGFVSFHSLALPGGQYFVSLRNKKDKAVRGFFVR